MTRSVEVGVADKSELLQHTGDRMALELTRALRLLTAHDIAVRFSGIETFERDNLVVDIQEKWFGCWARFRIPGSSTRGALAVIIPVSSAKSLIRLLQRRYRLKGSPSDAYHKLKLSGFREVINILLATYISGLANAMEIKIDTEVPRFVSGGNLAFMKSGVPVSGSDSDGTMSVQQFAITGGRGVRGVRGRFIAVF